MTLKKIVVRAAVACVIGLPALGLGAGAAVAAPAKQNDCNQKQLDCALSNIDLSQIRLSDVDIANIEQIQRDAENFQMPQLPNLSIPSIPTPPLLLPPPEFQLPDLPPPPPPQGPKLIRMPWEPKLPWELF